MMSCNSAVWYGANSSSGMRSFDRGEEIVEAPFPQPGVIGRLVQRDTDADHALLPHEILQTALIVRQQRIELSKHADHAIAVRGRGFQRITVVVTHQRRRHLDHVADAGLVEFLQQVCGQHFLTPMDAIGVVRTLRSRPLPIMQVGIDDHCGLSGWITDRERSISPGTAD